jgi:putative ABC transport system permease protein
MPTWLAYRNLLQSKVRTVVGTAGVAFAAVLIFFQFGLLKAVGRTATVVYDALEFDVLIRSRAYVEVSDPRGFSSHRLREALGVPGVAAASPLQIAVNEWRHPDAAARKYRMILTLGVRPGDPVFANPDLQSRVDRLTFPEHLLIDELSHREFGPRSGEMFQGGTEPQSDVGVRTEINERPVEIAGVFRLGAGFGADGAVIVNDRGFSRVTPRRGTDEVSLGLVRLEPGVDPEAAAAALRERLPTGAGGDVEVLTREEALSRERARWLWETSLGLVFFFGAVVACVVGSVIVYQVLASDVADRLPEYATLKAIGYRDRFLSGVVVSQALLLAVVGFAISWAVAAVMYRLTRAHARLPMELDAPLVLVVFGLALGICIASGLIALRKLRQAAPADLF